MSQRPSIFVSSTCYDLKQVRVDLKEFIESLGCEPVLSEYDSFPVSPGVGTVDNCLKVVESQADILVLVVGGRIGSTNDRGLSVTNLEFRTARAKGIPIYVFVVRSILSVLPVWRQNPSGEFSSVVDSPALFQFVSELRNTGDIWVFPFDTAQDICSTLRLQMAFLFGDALKLRLRAGQSGVLSDKLCHLRGAAFRTVIERPQGWQFLLFSEILEAELDRRKDLRRDWEYGIALGVGQHFAPSQFFAWFAAKISEAQRIIEGMGILFREALPGALGTGENSDAEAIIYVAERIAASYQNLLDWKIDFRRVAVVEEMKRLRQLGSSFCDNTITEIEEYSQTIKRTLIEVLAAPVTGEPRVVNIVLKLTAPDLTEYEAEMERVNALMDSGVLELE